MDNEKINIETKRHSLSHVLAAAVLELFPEAKLGIGPAIENGFYYDFDLPEGLTEKDLEKIEKKMREIINGNYKFTHESESKDKIAQFFTEMVQPYKAELAKKLPEDKATLYTIEMSGGGRESADFVDLCKGPHVASTIDLINLAWKLDRTAGAYWLNDEKNPMLTRIYGLAFETKEDLEKYENFIQEAAKRDHKKIGRELDLFSFHPEAPGEVFWHEKGMIIWRILEKYGQKLRQENGFAEIKTPVLAKNSLWITSGHWDHYKDSMFSFQLDKEIYCLKPMDCPFDIKIYNTKVRSYRDLPIRYTEIGHVYRHEKSGELNGLFRVQEITQDDSHIFLTESQIGSEIMRLLDMVKEYYKQLELRPEFFLSTRPDDFIGEIKTWDAAENDLKKVLAEVKIDYKLKEKDGAFYGPKIDIHVKDALNRAWQVATIQLDFQLPGRFNCKYIDLDGQEKTPVMIHAAIFGSFERMIGILIEHYAGNFPFWLAPIQAVILPIADRHLDYAQKIRDELLKVDIRVELDDRSETIGKKIREAEMQKIPYMLIVGDKEIDAKKIAVRKYGEGDKGQMDLEEFGKSVSQ